ncbi:MAG: LytTR family transcriptional regulator DNA-binding domain-containing protein [Clostridia bacterium]|nr:LytTR family transcriptional regulator DNA-binding domain-containing protein [Clostridia bacterium]
MNREVKIRFEEDPEANCIEICIRALKRDQGIDELIASISAALPEMITATGADGAFIKISTADIVSVSVNGKYLQIVTEKDRYIVRQSLHDFEEKLDAKNFVRISRYEIVNIGKIKKYDFTLGGTLRLELAGGMETWASRRSIPLIRKKLTEKE